MTFTARKAEAITDATAQVDGPEFYEYSPKALLGFSAGISIMAGSAHLGRTEFWKTACQFAQSEIRRFETENPAATDEELFACAKWAFWQGHIWQCHANS